MSMMYETNSSHTLMKLLFKSDDSALTLGVNEG